ncbi:hypothetical protein ACFSS9_04410 [Paenibacillus septentrionalis]|uniref:hypothetical protein n=1 Tax=Paenibacillus septentrionalis TaxID=429342 RepID=UPI00362BBD80
MVTYVKFTAKAFSKPAGVSFRGMAARLLGNFVTILIQVEIWRAVIGSGSVEGITLEQMITYSIINTLLLALLFKRYKRQGGRESEVRKHCFRIN